MKSFWLEWATRTPASLDANDEAHALALGEELTGEKPLRARSLYYRAEPVLDSAGRWPAYCLQPEQCAGKSYCTRSPCCDS